MRLVAAILAVPALLVAWQWWGDRSAEHLLAPVAASIAGRPVEVQCQTLWGSLIDVQSRQGEVFFDPQGVPEAKLFLTRATCKRLQGFARRTRHHELDCLAQVEWGDRVPLRPDSDCYRQASPAVYALLILAHEAYHTAGVRGEATANCYAIQALAWTASRLGAPDAEADLAARAMQALEPYQGTDYATTECVAGSRLDLHPETPEFPTEREPRPPLGRGGLPGLAAAA
jgi:hypothetical protein